MTTDHTNDGTFTRDEVHQAMDYAREHGDSRIVDDEGVTRLSFHVPHLDDPPHEPGCNCGESSECPTYAPGVPTLTPEAPPAIEGDWYWATDPDSGQVMPAKRGPNGWWRLAGGLHTQLCKVGPRIDPPGQPTEPPPLPDGWSKRGAGEAVSVRGCVVRYLCNTIDVQCDGEGIIFPADVARHLLGLTAPVADVRAALLAVQAKADDISGPGGDVALWELSEFIESLLTGKGAP